MTFDLRQEGTAPATGPATATDPAAARAARLTMDPATGDPAAADPATATARVAEHLDAVWRYLRMQGADPAQADDLAQETFVVALRRGVFTADPAALHTFLRRTARFLWLQSLSGRRRDVQLADAVDDLWDQRCRDDDGLGLVEAARTCIEQLDGRPRRAIELAYGVRDGEPRSRKAIARELGMKENGVKTMMHRLREKLRECIERRTQR